MKNLIETLALTILVVAVLYFATPLHSTALIAAGIIAAFSIYKVRGNANFKNIDEKSTEPKEVENKSDYNISAPKDYLNDSGMHPSKLKMVFDVMVKHRGTSVLILGTTLVIVIASALVARMEKINPRLTPGNFTHESPNGNSTTEKKITYDWKYFDSPSGDSFYIKLPTITSIAKPTYSTFCVKTCSTGSLVDSFRSSFPGVTLIGLYLNRSFDDLYGLDDDFPKYFIETGHINTTPPVTISTSEQLKQLYDAYISTQSKSSVNDKTTTISATVSVDGTYLDFYVFKSYMFSPNSGEIETRYERGRIILRGNNLYFLTAYYDDKHAAEKYAQDFETFVGSFGVKLSS